MPRVTKTHHILIRDDDAHWYCIPKSLEDTFSAMLTDVEFDDGCEFNRRFGKYRVGGSPSLVTFENPVW